MGTMKMTEKKLDKLVEMIKIKLTETLGREPTEKELLAKLPVFMCNIDEAPSKR